LQQGGAMPRRHRITRFAVLLALAAAGSAHALEPCGKNHYILDQPCALEWQAANGGLTDLDVRVVAVEPVRRSTLYAGGPSGGFKSVNGAGTWSATALVMTTLGAGSYVGPNPGPPRSYRAESIVARLAIDPWNPDTLYAGTIARGCFY